jgi:hypothetical protein
MYLVNCDFHRFAPLQLAEDAAAARFCLSCWSLSADRNPPTLRHRRPELFCGYHGTQRRSACSGGCSERIWAGMQVNGHGKGDARCGCARRRCGDGNETRMGRLHMKPDILTLQRHQSAFRCARSQLVVHVSALNRERGVRVNLRRGRAETSNFPYVFRVRSARRSPGR